MKSFTAWVLVTFGVLVIVVIFALPGCGDDCDPPPSGRGGIAAPEHHHGEGFPDPGHFHGPNGDSTHTHGGASPDGHKP